MKSRKVAGMLCLAMIGITRCTSVQKDDAAAYDLGSTVMDMAQSVQTLITSTVSQETSQGIQAVDTAQPIPSEFQGEGILSVHFIDVGQGDSILLSYEENGETEFALIDAGDNDRGTVVQKYLQDQGVDHIKYLILTHPDADHIGGADVIISKFDIDTIYMSAAEKDTATYRDVIDAIEYRSYTWSVPETGDVMMLGGAELEIIAAPYTYDDVNNNSIVIKATYADSSFLFMGDAEFEEEEELLDRFSEVDDTLDVDVLKAGHHGSYTSSSNEFIAEVTPEWTVISCGMDNQYGHPHNTSLYNFSDYESDLFRTDIQGSIVCITDGFEYSWNKVPTDNWKSGDEISENDYEYDR